MMKSHGKAAIGTVLCAIAMLGIANLLPAQTRPNVVVIVAEGTGFPFEDPSLAKFGALRGLRASSRPFENVFASDPAWRNTHETVLGGLGPGRVPGLLARLKGKYATTYVGPTTTIGGFDRKISASDEEISKHVLAALKSGTGPAFVYASLDLRERSSVGSSASVDAVPLTVPAISLSDRAPLDTPGFAVTPPPRDSADRSALAARRQAAFAAIDREVGRLTAGIQASGGTSHTTIVIVFAGPAPRPERPVPPRADLLFEDWMRALVLVSAPATPQPGVAATTIATLDDVAPTLAALAGVVPPKGEGRALNRALQDPKATVRTELLSSATREPPRIGRSIRTQDLRYTQWPDGSEELFDEAADPRELKNLAEEPAFQAKKAELAKKVNAPIGPPAPAALRVPTGRRPNVLFIIADDLTAQYPQFGEVKTPNLDRLRARGRSFDRAYAPAPFCTPSRAAFLSGMSPARLELQQDDPFREIFTPAIPLIQDQFKANGYFTASVGKVWDSDPGDRRGWDVNDRTPPLPAGATEQPAKLMPHMPVEAGPTSNPDEVEGDGRRARAAIRLLEETRDRPLFLALGFVRPHVAWVAPQKYFDMYPPEKIRFIQAPPNDTADIPAIAIKNRAQGLPGLMLAGREPAGFSDDPAEARRGIAAYLACVSFMDAQLGLVLDALDRGDRWKDTVVIFAGDNGHHFGDHGGLWRKNTLFEESLRVPLIIATPDLAQPGAASSSLADLIDLYPTLVDLTGIAKPGTLDGKSLLPILQNPRASVQDALIQYRPNDVSRNAYSLRTSQYRFTLWPDGAEELYDLRADPAGRKNLASSPSTAGTRATLRKRLEALVKP